MAYRTFGVLALLMLLGCAQRDGATHRGDLPRIVGTGRAEWGPAWGPAYVIHYETGRDVWNVPELRKEADSLWATLRPSVEALGVCVVQLRASEPEREQAVPGTQVALTARRNWDFLLFRDTTGQWKWLASVIPPPNPCTPR